MTTGDLEFPPLHDLARHMSHSTETLEVAGQTAQSIMNEQARWKLERTSLIPGTPRWSEPEQRRLLFVSDEFHALKARSNSLNERLQNEINLVGSELSLQKMEK